ncbi:MAG: DUF262 domain-containing protein [Bacteroidota bacterium]|nr:DUF262 domain-containing protein [Bacteroidota bacterium]
MKIQDYINNRNKYKVDYNYQRPNDAWSKEDKQCLIDTILKGEPMPIFFMNFKSDEEAYYIVDGQQRLTCISLFYENQLKLSEKFSGKDLNGKTFNGEKPLGDLDKSNFLDYELNLHIMEDYDDERVRLIFSRLQRGKPLSLGERLNAKPGTIVELMRNLANHNFIEKSTAVAKNRYGVFPDTARIIFYEKFGAKQCGSNELYSFFDNYKELDANSKEFKNAKNILNFLEKCFPTNPGNYKFLEKHAWVIAVYTMIRDLKLTHSLIGKEETIHKFIRSFHSKVYSEDFRNSNVNYQRFYDNVRGGWSEKIIMLRRDILIREFLSKYPLDELDDRRQISDEEKISIFSEKQNCELCSAEFKDYKEAEYHHKTRYADGGKSEIGNIMILCSKCHDEIHGQKIEISLPSEDEKEEVE